MKNVERNEEAILQQLETIDREGTYEQKNGNDLGNNTVFSGNATVIVQKKTKKKQAENIIYTD